MAVARHVLALAEEPPHQFKQPSPNAALANSAFAQLSIANHPAPQFKKSPY